MIQQSVETSAHVHNQKNVHSQPWQQKPYQNKLKKQIYSLSFMTLKEGLTQISLEQKHQVCISA